MAGRLHIALVPIGGSPLTPFLELLPAYDMPQAMLQPDRVLSPRAPLKFSAMGIRLLSL
jgi:hypothetical protein